MWIIASPSTVIQRHLQSYNMKKIQDKWDLVDTLSYLWYIHLGRIRWWLWSSQFLWCPGVWGHQAELGETDYSICLGSQSWLLCHFWVWKLLHFGGALGCPPPSNSGKWRLIGVPFWTYNNRKRHEKVAVAGWGDNPMYALFFAHF